MAERSSRWAWLLRALRRIFAGIDYEVGDCRGRRLFSCRPILMVRFARQAYAGVNRRSGAPNTPSPAVRPAGRFATIPPRWPLPRTCCVHARLSAMVRGLAERVAVTAESRVAPSCDASSSHAPVTGADRGGAMLLSSTGGDRLSGRSSDKPAAPADDSTSGRSSPADTLSDSLSGTPSAHLCGKPCDRPAVDGDTRTGSSQPPPSPDRCPPHLTTIPARVRHH